MKALRKLWVVLFAAYLGCADGGPVGTGISSSSISGNVTAVDEPAGSTAGLLVGIDEAPGIEDTTDANGNFELIGNFSGPITVRFTTAQISAPLSLDVPAGSGLDLQDIEIRGTVVVVNRTQLRKFRGRVALIDCATDVPGTGDVFVNDFKVTANQFMVRLLADTIIVRGDGTKLQCADIRSTDPISIDGVIRPDRTVVAIVAVIAPPPLNQPQPIKEVRFRGTVTPLIQCETGNILIDEVASGVVRLKLSNTSLIVTGDLDRVPLQCADIQAGDQVEGVGLLQVRGAQVPVVLVGRMTVKPPATL